MQGLQGHRYTYQDECRQEFRSVLPIQVVSRVQGWIAECGGYIFSLEDEDTTSVWVFLENWTGLSSFSDKPASKGRTNLQTNGNLREWTLGDKRRLFKFQGDVEDAFTHSQGRAFRGLQATTNYSR